MFRSLLLVPGSSIRMILAGLEVDAAVLILDLVDGVAPDQKPESRSMVAQILREIDFQGRKVLVRINSLRTEWGLEDARAAVAGGVDGILIPKVESVDEVLTIATVLNARQDRSRARPQILAEVGTPRGLLASREVAESNELVTGLICGGADLTQSFGSRPTDGEPELLMARSQILLAARVAGIGAYDAPDYGGDNPDQLIRRARAMRHLGYDGMVATQPDQIAIINDWFGDEGGRRKAEGEGRKA